MPWLAKYVLYKIGKRTINHLIERHRRRKAFDTWMKATARQSRWG